MYQRHQYISYTIITYIQMAFNAIVTITLLYIFIKIVLVVKQDFKLKALEHFDILHQAKISCTRNYMLNHCGQEDRVPALETMCTEWENCMQKDIVVAQAKVSAEAIAEIINSFVEPISYKTLLFFTLLVIGSLVFSNMAFGLFRRKYAERIAA
ncbi:Brl1/Brr6 domain-containing protein [Helicostylum pulchrum]|nr:Brl1/Brr6 domain-containing protein [Helicostylum pulchrum]